MRRGSLCVALMPLLLGAAAVPDTRGELATGIQRVQDGDLEGGLLTLDGVARRLAAEQATAHDLAQAQLYLGIAYLGLQQDALAHAKFREALRQQPDLRLSPEEFPAKALRAFAQARRAIAEAAALEKAAKTRRGAGGVLLLGVGGVAAAGIATAAIQSDAPNRAPTASMTIAPEGQAISGVTKLTFSATATDPDGDALSYNWRFGDGTSASGTTVTHVYEGEGSFVATLTVSDGASPATIERSVTARTLTGSWRVLDPGFRGTTAYQIQQAGANLDGTAVVGNVRPRIFVGSRVTHPREVVMTHADVVGPGFDSCRLEIAGQADASLNVITGRETCSRCRPCLPDQQRPITIVRP